MTFKPDVNLDPGRVRDVRGRRVRGGGLAVGGGLGTLVIVALILLTGGDLGDVIGGLGAAPPVEGPIGSQLINECDTGADANERQDCRLLGAVQSLDAYWSDTFTASGEAFQQPEVVIFTDGVNTAVRCGVRARSGRSTARSTRRSTSTSASTTTSRRDSEPRAARSRRCTSSPTSTDTTSRTCSASSTRAATPVPGAVPCASSSRPTASRAPGAPTRSTPASSSR